MSGCARVLFAARVYADTMRYKHTHAYAYLRIMVSIIKWDLYHQPNRTEQRAECESVH